MAISTYKSFSVCSKAVYPMVSLSTYNRKSASFFYFNPNIGQISSVLFTRIKQDFQRQQFFSSSSQNLVNAKSIYSNCVSHSYNRSLCIIPVGTDSNRFPFMTLLLAMLVGTQGLKKVYTDGDEDGDELDLSRTKYLLEKKVEPRTTEEKIYVFNTIVRVGRKASEKFRDKDIVMIIGNTDAGKSTLINFLCGRKMIINQKGEVEVQPPSAELAEIGNGGSCTLIPQLISFDVLITETVNPIMQDNVGPITQQREIPLHFCDTPGFRDNRGIEIALANAMVMKSIIEKVKSVKIVFLFEHSLITGEYGIRWKEAVTQLDKRFNYGIGGRENSLCLVVTKSPENTNIESVKNNMRDRMPPGHTDFSKHAMMYSPLRTEDRDALLSAIFKITPHRGLPVAISADKDELWSALELGGELDKSVEEHLKKDEIKQAVEKLEFSHKIASLGNKDLTKMHEQAQKAVQTYAQAIVKDITPQLSFPIGAKALKKYDHFKEPFEPFVSFDELDDSLKANITMINANDPRTWYEQLDCWIREHLPFCTVPQKYQDIISVLRWKPRKKINN